MRVQRLGSRQGALSALCVLRDVSSDGASQLDPADYGKVNPSVPTFGGPTGVRTTSLSVPEAVFSYGNSILRQGITLLSPKYGTNLQEAGGGWSHQVGTISPGIPGDSGSGFFDGNGKAFGILSTLSLAPIPATNGVGDLSALISSVSPARRRSSRSVADKELAYLHKYPEFADVQLAVGTQPFKVALPSP